MHEINETPINTVTPEHISELIENKQFAAIRSYALSVNPEDFAALIAEVPRKMRVTLFRLLSKEYAAECFVALDTDVRLELVEAFTDGELSSIIGELFLDDTVDIIEEVPASVVKRILRAAPASERETINRLLGYPTDSAGALMTPEYVRLLPDMTVADALGHIRRVAIDSETVYTCYVTDSQRRLIGIVTAKQLLISDEQEVLSKIMNTSPVFVTTTTSREETLSVIRKYSFLALPVVDNETRLVGIVTVDDALDAVSEDAEDDFAKMAAITPGDSEYLKTPVFKIWLSRIPWLLLLLVSATLSSTMLSGFEAALPAVLVLFVPMLMDTGGNCGSQSSVTVIRALSLGTLTPRQAPRVILKELSVGVLAAAALGAAALLKVLLIDRLIAGNTAVTLQVAFSVAAALALTVIMAKLVGALLPLLVKRIGLDPAVMASPFITTLVDALSLGVYFLIAKAMLG